MTANTEHTILQLFKIIDLKNRINNCQLFDKDTRYLFKV